MERPKYQILKAIYGVLNADQNLVIKHLKSYKSCTPEQLAKLKQKDQVFCSAYYEFLYRLIEAPLMMKPTITSHQTIFHVGDSHCLSYANKAIKFQGLHHKVIPRITFGGKAYHLSREKEDIFKAITKANLDSLPDMSKVFVSFGEIDCRPNEELSFRCIKT